MSLPHSEKLTLPYVALLATVSVWKISLAEGFDPKFSFINTKPNAWGTHPAVDAFDECEEFLALQTPQEGLRFFERYGPFQLHLQKSADPRQWKALPIRWSGIQQAQSDFKSARLSQQINLADRIHSFVFRLLRGIELKFQPPEIFEVARKVHRDGRFVRWSELTAEEKEEPGAFNQTPGDMSNEVSRVKRDSERFWPLLRTPTRERTGTR